jgi:hypothetical protein
MSSSISSTNPLSYLGLPETDVPQVTIAKRPPTRGDLVGRKIGDLWVDKVGQNVYAFVAAVNGEAMWSQLGNSTNPLATLTGDVGRAVTPDTGNINLQGGASGAIQFSNGGPGQLNAAVQVDNSTIKIVGNQLTAAHTINWSVINADTPGVANQGYFVNDPGNINISLPATSEVGDTFSISEINTGTWTITQSAGQQIRLGNAQSTLGAGGSLVSSAPGDSLMLFCYQANTSWIALSAIGNITIN